MARTGITYEQVATVADALVGQGEKPSIQRIREQLGTGSPNTIHRHLKAWRATQAPAERRAARLPDELA
ncbi:mucin, partial [Halomonas sp. S2151]